MSGIMKSGGLAGYLMTGKKLERERKKRKKLEKQQRPLQQAFQESQRQQAILSRENALLTEGAGGTILGG